MALVLGAWSLGVPLKGKGHPPVKQLNAKHDKYGQLDSKRHQSDPEAA